VFFFFFSSRRRHTRSYGDWSSDVCFPIYMIYDSHWILSDELFTKHAKFSLKPYNDDYGTFHLSWSWNFLPTGTNPPKEAPDHIKIGRASCRERDENNDVSGARKEERRA